MMFWGGLPGVLIGLLTGFPDYLLPSFTWELSDRKEELAWSSLLMTDRNTGKSF